MNNAKTYTVVIWIDGALVYYSKTRERGSWERIAKTQTSLSRYIHELIEENTDKLPRLFNPYRYRALDVRIQAMQDVGKYEAPKPLLYNEQFAVIY